MVALANVLLRRDVTACSRNFDAPARILIDNSQRADSNMGKFDKRHFNIYADRTQDLARGAARNVRQLVSQDAGKWLETGVKLGALKGGARVAGGYVRRNPVVVVAAVAGAGLLLYATYRRSRQGPQAAIEGRAKRVQARRAEAGESRRKPAASRRPAAVSAPDSDN